MGTSYSVLPETAGLVVQGKKPRLSKVLPGVLWSLLAFSTLPIQRPPPAAQKAFSSIFYRHASFKKKIMCHSPCDHFWWELLGLSSRTGKNSSIGFHKRVYLVRVAHFPSKLTAVPQTRHASSSSRLVLCVRAPFPPFSSPCITVCVCATHHSAVSSHMTRMPSSMPLWLARFDVPRGNS